MGCGSSKKIVNDSSPSDRKLKPTLLPDGTASVSQSSSNKNSTKRKYQEKSVKGGKFRVRFDTLVAEKYDIKALIGHGSFSKVVRVEDRVTKQPYAIKMIEIDEGKEVFESELAVLRRVQHAYVVSLYEVFECREKVYLVMELATGGELFDRIVSRGYFTERDATHVLYMVLEGVRYLHSLGITHRDLKPENLLYYHPGNDSKIMITDFGLSNLKKNPDQSTMETTCGTPEYIAPEILLSKPYTNSVDIWSIGVISFILLSGAMPFSDDNRTRLYRAILKAKYSYSGEPWNDVSDLAKSFIDKLLVLESEKRMTAEEGLKHPWIASFAASSSFKNLHGSISSNWLKSSSRLNSAKSNRSKRSSRSSKSSKSMLSKYTTSIPLHVSKPPDQEKSNSSGRDTGVVAPESSKSLNGNLKLTRPLFEKLQSAAREEIADSSSSIDSTVSQASAHINTEMQIAETIRENTWQHSADVPPANSAFFGIGPKINFDSPLLDVNCEEPYQPSSLHLPTLDKLTERDEDSLIESQHNPEINKTILLKPVADRQDKSLFNEGLFLPKPFAMDVDCTNNNSINNLIVPSTSGTNSKMGFMRRPLPSPKRNRVSSSL